MHQPLPAKRRSCSRSTAALICCWPLRSSPPDDLSATVDRVTDGVDQTALLLLGEDHGRRNMIFHYSGGVLGAIRYEDFKVHITEGHGGLPGMDFYNVMRDPGEKFGQLYPGLFVVTPQGAELTPHD